MRIDQVIRVGACAVLLCGAVSLSACEAAKKGELKIPVSQADANASVKQQFPKKNKLAGGLTLEALNPQLTFKATPDKKGEVLLKVDIKMSRSPIPLSITGDATLSGKLRYDGPTKTLYLEQNEIKQLNVAFPSKKTTALASALLQDKLSKIKLYTLDAKKNNVVTRNLLKRVSVTNGKMYLHFGM